MTWQRWLISKLGGGGEWEESICGHQVIEASPAGGFTQIPSYPCLCNFPSDFAWTQTVVWHHPCLLHNQNVFSCKLLPSLSRQVFCLCMVIFITECQLGDPHHGDEEMGTLRSLSRPGSDRVLAYGWELALSTSALLVVSLAYCTSLFLEKSLLLS